ncbi:hypothetical protein J5Y03_08355 [Bacillus sp. RG28]|uniref:Uncharacterized protein n=1 Tax=Gottfriedia endophytica TaxID=2820819 RepID=A0A940NN50_9BACI|nr:hypothetical protein [Gottfriedia endophytica]MBP0725204.1 hypothetical protein [Gottfriedia endophytica]
MKLFWTEEALISYIINEINLEDYEEEKDCECIICHAKRFGKVKKKLETLIN